MVNFSVFAVFAAQNIITQQFLCPYPVQNTVFHASISCSGRFSCIRLQETFQSISGLPLFCRFFSIFHSEGNENSTPWIKNDGISEKRKLKNDIPTAKKEAIAPSRFFQLNTTAPLQLATPTSYDNDIGSRNPYHCIIGVFCYFG